MPVLTSYRIILFFDSTQPLAFPDEQYDLAQRLAHKWGVTPIGLSELAPALAAGNAQSVLVNCHGSYFPEALWLEFLAFLERGGNWMNIGGPPLRHVGNVDSVHLDQPGRNAAHRELGLYHHPLVSGKRLHRYQLNPYFSELTELSLDLPLQDIHECYFTLVNEVDRTKLDVFTHPIGEAQNVLMGRGEGDRPLAAPVLCLDHLWGRFNGSRWLLVNWELSPELLSAVTFTDWIDGLLKLCWAGAEKIILRPGFACYHPGENPVLQFYSIGSGLDSPCKVKVKGAAFDREDASQAEFSLEISLEDLGNSVEVPLPASSCNTPGFYHIRADLTSESGFHRQVETGFWRQNVAMVQSGPRFTVGNDFILKDDAPYPVMGTSYMASDVHRWYFLDPNPLVWQRDIEGFTRDGGLNLIRTGVWMGANYIMPHYGLGSEPALRAFEAFIHTCVTTETPVIFNLMAFSPSAGNGVSPWFDPASIRWQREFISLIVRRFRNCPWIIWDVINEPTLSDPNRLWYTRPNGDRYERAAWREWLAQKHGTVENLRRSWDASVNELPDFNAAPVPTEMDFVDQNWTLDEIHHQRAIDFRWFTQDHFRHWLQGHATVIQRLGHHQLITMGQDEGGLFERPNPPQHADVIDVTAIHSWTENDDILAVILQSRTPGVPHLFGETGAFPQDDPNKDIRKDEDYLWRLYERKFVYAFAARSAGNIHWIWNTAPRNSGEKEVAVGGLRASGSEKNEVIPLKMLAHFLRLAGPVFGESDPDPVCVLVPYANVYAPRNPTLDIVRNSLRTLYFDLNTSAYCASDIRPEQIGDAAVIIVPAPRTLTQSTWDILMEKARLGSTVIISGAIDYDEYWKWSPRLAPLGIVCNPLPEPVSRHEFCEIGASEYSVCFTHGKQDYIEKAILSETGKNDQVVIPIGNGHVIYCPLPLEIADHTDALCAHYLTGLKMAGVYPLFKGGEDPSVLVRPVVNDNAIIYTIISESDQSREVSFLDSTTGITISSRIDRRRAQLFVLDRHSSQLKSVYFSGKLQVDDLILESESTAVLTLGETEWQCIMGEGESALNVTGWSGSPLQGEFLIQLDQSSFLINPDNPHRFTVLNYLKI